MKTHEIVIKVLQRSIMGEKINIKVKNKDGNNIEVGITPTSILPDLVNPKMIHISDEEASILVDSRTIDYTPVTKGKDNPLIGKECTLIAEESGNKHTIKWVGLSNGEVVVTIAREGLHSLTTLYDKINVIVDSHKEGVEIDEYINYLLKL